MRKYPNYLNFPYFMRKLCGFILALLWFVGLCCGILLGLSADNSIISWMRCSFRSHVSIVSLLSVTVFPLLLSAYAVFSIHPKPLLMIFICFFKAVVHGYGSMLIYQAFGNHGWLIRFLLLFHGCISATVLLFFLLHVFSGNKQYLRDTLLLLIALDILAASAEYRIFVPALAYWI